METLQEYLEKQVDYYEKLMIEYGNEFGREAEELHKLQGELTSLKSYYDEYRDEVKKFEAMLQEYKLKNK
jgi:hypothetical protein